VTTAIAMPKLGMTMREGTVVEWLVAVGGAVEKGRPVLAIETEKSAVEIEAAASGVLRHVYVAPGETVPCGTLLGAITASMDEAFDAAAFHREHDCPERPAPAAATPRPAPGAAAARAPAGRAPAAPAARALAQKLGIDVAAVPGTGPGGRVTKEDVEALAARRERLVEVASGVRLEVLRVGAGDPVVFLPGFGTDVSAFAPQSAALAATHAVVGINPRGVGGSDAPDLDRYDVATAAADVAAIVTTPAHVVGASLGAAVAIELALAHPERIKTLTLITPFVEASARLRAVAEAWARFAAEARAETVARALLPWLFSERLLADAAARERTVRGLTATVANVPAATLARTTRGLVAWSGTRGADLHRLAMPTLVLVAGADLLAPGGDAVGRAIPGARTIVVPAAGHALTIDAAESVTAALAAHVRP
jgi:pyruvate dehydrogenase E2 component (dihydrolipoamide acetyltransferase)